MLEAETGRTTARGRRSAPARVGRVLVACALAAAAAFFAPPESLGATPRTWVGPAGGNWSDPAHWSPVGAPGAGDSLIFRGDGRSVDDLPALVLDALVVEDDAGDTAHTVEVVAGAKLDIRGGIQGAGDLRKSGAGLVVLGGATASSGAGTLFVDDGSVVHAPDGGATTLPQHVHVGTAASLELAGSRARVHSMVVEGALFLGSVGEMGTPSVATLVTDRIEMKPASVPGVVIGGAVPGTTTDRIETGYASIDEAALLVDVATTTPPVPALRLIDNTGGAPIVGTFVDGGTGAPLAEGATLSAFDSTFRASYAGGTGNDFTLTYVAPPAPPTPRVSTGYWMAGRDGGVFAFGGVPFAGGPGPQADVVDLESTPSGAGYWIATATGRVHPFGDAVGHGDATGRLEPGERIVSMSSVPSGTGYRLFTDRGRVMAFGTAAFLGDVGGAPLNGPVLDSVTTPTGDGYYMVASDGGVFAFGDARFFGSMGGRPLNAPVASLVPDADNTGYWLVARDGGVFAFDASFRGSMGGTRLNRPVIGMVRFGDGYLMVGEDGGIFNFSNKPFFGSLGGTPLTSPIVAVAVHD